MTRPTVRPEHVYDLVRGQFDHPAQEFLEGETEKRIVEWIRSRIEKLDIRAGDSATFACRLNPWNETHGLGLQSVSLELRRLPRGHHKKKGRPFDKCIDVLLPGEWKHPTIGVIAPGLLNDKNAHHGLVRFPVDSGKSEYIERMSPNLYMDAVVANQKDNPLELPRRLDKDMPLIVSGPNAVRTLCQLQKVDDPQAVRILVHRAVYACQFFKTSKSE